MDILNVYLNARLVGTLSRFYDKNEYIFEYDKIYLSNPREFKPLSISLPYSSQSFVSKNKLHSYFDNLAPEGWLADKQSGALKIDLNDKFSILAHYGFDLIGSVSIEKQDEANFEFDQLKMKEEQKNSIEFEFQVDCTDKEDSSDSQNSTKSINSNSTMSGVQKKFLVNLNSNGQIVFSGLNNLSTHIAKCKSKELLDLIELEFLSTKVVKLLLPEDEVCSMEIKFFDDINENVLFIERFDRNHFYDQDGTVLTKRIHFEEFNQLFGLSEEEKYHKSYDEMGAFIKNNKNVCDQNDVLKLFKRILACILIGNTDAHLKNFAMFHNEENNTLSLTPIYDMVASSYYPKYDEIALEMNGIRNQKLKNIKPKHLVDFALNPNGFDLNQNELIKIVTEFEINMKQALLYIDQCEWCPQKVKSGLKDIIIKRWNGSFAGIKNYLEKTLKKKKSRS